MKKTIFGISLLTLTCLYGLLAGLVILIVMLCGGDILYAIVGCIIVLIIQFLISPWLTDLSMKWFYKVRFDQNVPEFVRKTVEDMATKYNAKMPKIGIIEDGGPNAFTYGRTKNDARIVLTRGMFNLLTEEEVKAVIAHEMGHIVHYDMLVMTVAQIIPLVLYAIYETFTRSADGDSDNKIAAVIGFVAYILYIISQYVILYLSRTREYFADEFSCDETKNPNALAEALVKIGFGLSTRDDPGKKHNVHSNTTLGISDSKGAKTMAIGCINQDGTLSKDKIKESMKWEMWNPWAKWFELNSTHPLISNRLKAISKKSAEYGQEAYIVFDLEKPESYVDDFMLELFISFLPVIVIIGCLIAFISTQNSLMLGLTFILGSITSFIRYKRSHSKKEFKNTNVASLLGEVKVSNITSIPCTLEGTIIGRGDPGCIFNEDFIIKDETGIIFLQYNQPLVTLNKLFALFRAGKYIDKKVTIKGWYKRSPVPYVEILEIITPEKTKKIHTYNVTLAFHILFILIGLFMMTL